MRWLSMKEAMEAILSRRSVRKYTNKEVTDEVVQQLLKAAMSAPSAHNQQPWHFVVIKDKEILNKIPKFHPFSKMLSEASLAILVCGSMNLHEKSKPFWVQDCSAALQNILIAANAFDLGAVWLGVYPVDFLIDAIRKLTNLPENIMPFGMVSLGYPAEEKSPADRFDESRIHINKW